MKPTNYQAGPAGDASVSAAGDRWTLVFVRELRHPPERVWQALTDPAELAAWAPFDASRNLAQPGEAVLAMAGDANGETFPSEVRRAQFPRLLEYTWDKDILRWELEPSGEGTRLTLRHTLTDRTWLPKVTAGWHICLDVADAFMAGTPVGRIVAEEAMKHGWERLMKEYAARFGIDA